MIVGIDLGTTNSLIAYFTEDGPKIIPNRLGKNLTPSIVSVDEEGNVYCVRQFRYPFEESVLEIPAGKLELGEDPFECAVRELSEETGFTAGEYTL